MDLNQTKTPKTIAASFDSNEIADVKLKLVRFVVNSRFLLEINAFLLQRIFNRLDEISEHFDFSNSIHLLRQANKQVQKLLCS